MNDIIEQIRPLNLSEEVSKQIRELIMSGKIKTGQKLPNEKELAKMFGVGNSTIREAIVELKGAGLVEVRRPHGTFVLPVSALTTQTYQLGEILQSELKNVCDFYEIRKKIESDCAYAAAQHADDETIEKMRVVIEQMKEAMKQNQLDLWLSTDGDLHLLIAECSKNQVNSYFINLFSNLLYSTRSQRLIMDPVSKSKEILQEHIEIYEAIKDRNPEAARERMIRHIGNSVARVKEKWSKTEESG